MQIFFKFLTGKTVTLELQKPTTVKDVLALIRDKEGDEYFQSDKKHILCIAGKGLHDDDLFLPAEECISCQDGNKHDLIRDVNFIYILGTSLISKSEQTKNVGSSSNFLQSFYQQLTIEQKQYLSGVTQQVRHSIDIGDGKHPSTEDYFNNWLTNDEQKKLLDSFSSQNVSNPTNQRCIIQ